MWGPEKNLHCPSHLWHKKIRQTSPPPVVSYSPRTSPWTPLIGLLSHTSVALVRPRGAGIHSFAVAWFQYIVDES
ncbi:hypothetical protein AFLA_005500 [Aspergillus flavus NRRL3357]|nr:hypothetical protein AFLA_005500 [Aspergillus flavus NRRL3357]